MKFGPTRGNFLLIFEHFLRDFGLMLLLIIVAIVKGPEILFQNISWVVLVLITPVMSVSKYLFTKYSIDDEKVIIQSGLFMKKTMEIPLKSITTVDLSQNLLFQIFNVCKLKADNASQTNETEKDAEFVMALKKEEAMMVKSLLESKGKQRNSEDEETERLKKESEELLQPSVSCSVSDFILLGVLQSKQLYIITMISTIYVGYQTVYSTLFGDSDTLWWAEDFVNKISPVVGIILLLLVAYLIGMIASSVVTAIRYYGYTVTDRKDALLVKFGLLTKKSYTLSKEKISGVTIKQSVLMRVFGYCTVEVFIIGYGDSSDGKDKELSILHPIAKLSQVNYILEEILPELEFKRDYHKSEKGSLRYYFYSPRVLVAIIGIIAAGVILAENAIDFIYPWYVGGAIAIILFTILSVYLEYRNSGIYANSRVVSICSGIFAKQMVFVKTGNIESVSERTSIWKRRKGFTTVKLGFLAPIRVSHVKARNVTYKEYDAVQSVLNI